MRSSSKDETNLTHASRFDRKSTREVIAKPKKQTEDKTINKECVLKKAS